MDDAQPVEVFVISPHEINRTGITHVINEQAPRAVVVEAREEDGYPTSGHVVVYDVSAGFEAAAVSGARPADEELRHLIGSGVPVVVVAPALRPDLGRRSLSFGAAAAVTCDITGRDLVDVIEQAATGDRPGVAVPMSDRRHTVREMTGLTVRQLEVLELVAAGLDNREIAHRLDVSINTLKSTIRVAYQRVGVTTRSQAVLWAVDVGFAAPTT